MFSLDNIQVPAFVDYTIIVQLVRGSEIPYRDYNRRVVYFKDSQLAIASIRHLLNSTTDVEMLLHRHGYYGFSLAGFGVNMWQDLLAVEEVRLCESLEEFDAIMQKSGDLYARMGVFSNAGDRFKV